jgi:TetR/AcrR family transcriptional regulator
MPNALRAKTRATERVTRPSAQPTRDRIVAAAVDAFSERSFDGASTREIAARAGVTQPLLNYHFNSKEDLWRAAVDSLFELLNQTLDERTTGLRGVDEVTSAKLRVREFVTFSARHPQLHRIIMQESKADGPRMDYLVDHHVRPIYQRTIDLFASLARQGAVPPIPPAHLYYIVTGAGPTMFVLSPECRRLTTLDPSDDSVIEAHADAVCLLLFGSA